MALGDVIGRFSGSIIILWGWRAYLVALVAGGCSAFAMAPFHIFPILFVTFPVLVWLMDGALGDPGRGVIGRLWPAARIGWLFGFGYFLVSMWWLGKAFLVDADQFAWLLPFAVALLPAGLALFWAFGLAIARIFWRDGWRRILALTFGLGLAEWLRGTLFTGLPWNAIGYAAMPVPAMMQSASVIGLYGVTLGAIFVFAAPAVMDPGSVAGERRSGPRRVTATLVVALLLSAVHVGFGVFRLGGAVTDHVDDLSLRILQPAIPQEEKWLPQRRSEIFAKLINLSNASTSPSKQSLEGTDLLIWPESVFPFVLTDQPDAIAAIAALLPDGTSLITGALREEKAIEGKTEGFTFNSLYVINDKGEITAARDKVHLVPFGEYLPFQPLLESIGLNELTDIKGGFSKGVLRRTVALGKYPAFLPLICYEIIFPTGLSYDGEAPGWIVNLTNDAWFGLSPGPHQHLHQAQVRAVEQGLPVVRAANTGISAIIDPYGRITRALGLGQSGVIDGRLPVALEGTVFANIRNSVFLAVLGLILLLMIAIRAKAR
ncbi:MAG: apolipoprotein N-acyltransferase [Pseudomonadota bacterium]